MEIYSVTEINSQVRELLEDTMPTIWVEGEVSNFKPHYSGHFYFTLKDENSQISCVMWKSRASVTDFQIQDGDKVQILANLRVYVKSGRYQLDTIKIQKSGIGELQLKFEELKEQLYGEGLFDEIHKKSLPLFPFKIGVITSPTSAAIKDIFSVLKRRMPAVDIYFKGVKVQGGGAAEEIANAIDEMSELDELDVLIIGRGGGSIEDLWAFNEEKVARAIFNCTVPVISAVGHEIDFTISDFVADFRAPTPSVAAEIAVPDKSEIEEKLITRYNQILNHIESKTTQSKEMIIRLISSYAFRKPESIIMEHQQLIDEMIIKLQNWASNLINSKKNTLDNLRQKLALLHPENELNRGYAMLFKDKQIISSVDEININDIIKIKVKDGKLESIIKDKTYEKRKNI